MAKTGKTVKDLIREAADTLVSGQSDSESAKLDAQLLLGHVLKKDRTWLFTWDDVEVGLADQDAFGSLVSRRFIGEPIAHIIATREFWGLQLECNASTLIPRPETELLIEQALQLGLPENARVLDLGTGTGAIALALASERPDWHIQAVDFSDKAVALAQKNRDRHSLTNVEIFRSNWFASVRVEKLGSESNVTNSTLTPIFPIFDLIVSNPPYIDPESHHLNQGDLRFEPQSALVADNSGMADIEQIVSEASNYLNPEGWLILEHGFDQEQRVQDCFIKAGFQQIQTIKDLAGLPRVTLGQMHAAQA